MAKRDVNDLILEVGPAKAREHIDRLIAEALAARPVPPEGPAPVDTCDARDGAFMSSTVEKVDMRSVETMPATGLGIVDGGLGPNPICFRNGYVADVEKVDIHSVASPYPADGPCPSHIPHDFDGRARRCPTWEGFLSSALPDIGARDRLQEWFGRCLKNRESAREFVEMLDEGLGMAERMSGPSRGGKALIYGALGGMLGMGLDPNPNVGATEGIPEGEMPAMINWSIRGLQRLEGQGDFTSSSTTMPAAGLGMVDTSPILVDMSPVDELKKPAPPAVPSATKPAPTRYDPTPEQALADARESERKWETERLRPNDNGSGPLVDEEELLDYCWRERDTYK
jgi:hypothetical protein